MAETQETKIRKGQAYNNAAEDARATGRLTDIPYLYKRFIIHQHLIDLMQSSDQELIQQVVDCPEFNKAIEMLEKSMEKVNETI